MHQDSTAARSSALSAVARGGGPAGSNASAASRDNPQTANATGEPAALINRPNTEGPSATISRSTAFCALSARPLQNGPANSGIVVNGNPLSPVSAAAVTMTGTASDQFN